MVVTVASVALAIVRVPIAPLLTEPLVSSGQASQLLAGHPVDILEVREDWLRVCGEDGYEGWVHRGYLSLLERDAGWDTHPSPDIEREPHLSLGCVATTASREVRRLPLGAWLEAGDCVEEGEVLSFRERERQFPRDAAAICATARRFFEGTSYQWGGVTPWGADCSGLVQTVFGLHGIELPRDAWQQALQGRDAGTDILSFAPGVLLFFSDRADQGITHVGISCGPGRMMHLALGRGGWAEERLDDPSDPYVATIRDRFLAAREVIDLQRSFSHVSQLTNPPGDPACMTG